MTPPSEQSEVEELTTLFKYAVTRGAFNDLKATSIRIAEILDALSAAPAPTRDPSDPNRTVTVGDLKTFLSDGYSLSGVLFKLNALTEREEAEITGKPRAAAPAPEPDPQGVVGTAEQRRLVNIEKAKLAPDAPADDAETDAVEAWLKDRGLWDTADTPTMADLRAFAASIRADERRQWCEALDAIGCPSTPEKATAAVKSYAGYVEHGVRADERRKCAEACRSLIDDPTAEEHNQVVLKCIRTIKQQGGASDE